MDPRQWPLRELDLDETTESDARELAWVVATQPAVKDLGLAHYEAQQLMLALMSVSRTVRGSGSRPIE